MPNVISKPTNLALRDYTKNERSARIRQSIHWYKVNTKTTKKLYRNLTAEHVHVTFDFAQADSYAHERAVGAPWPAAYTSSAVRKQY
jgi:hypothetical protein